MRDYFNIYGCLRCKTKNLEYQANAMRFACANIVTIPLRSSVQRRLECNSEIVSGGYSSELPREPASYCAEFTRDHRIKKRLRNQNGLPNPELDPNNRLVDMQRLP